MRKEDFVEIREIKRDTIEKNTLIVNVLYSSLVHLFLAAEIQFSVLYRHLDTFEFSLHFSLFFSSILFLRIQFRTVKLLIIADRRALTVFKVDYLIPGHKRFPNVSFAVGERARDIVQLDTLD